MKSKTRGENIVRCFYFLLSLTFFAVAIFLFLTDKVSAGTACATFGTLILFIANLDRIESFKGLGLKAKTRGLEKLTTKGEAALTRLQTLNEVNAKSRKLELEIALGVASGRPPRDLIDKLKLSIEELDALTSHQPD